MEMTLNLPRNYVEIEEEEMMYLEGGAIAAGTVIAMIAGATSFSYNGGKAVGERLYYAGIRTSSQWSKYKWQARVAALLISPIFGSIFMVGLENKLYSKMKR